MIGAFRALGGTADNIGLGHGTLGRGLFPLDAAKPVRLHVPENLLFAVEDVEFTDEGPRIGESTGVAKPEREFFENYEATFSWGGGGRAESAQFIAALDALPPDVRALLIADFGMGEFLEGDPGERTRKRFLKSRVVGINGKEAVMPVIELANHGTEGLLYEFDAGLKIEGKPGAEVLVRYNSRDAFGIFHAYGFASPQPQAFSVPMKTSLGAAELVIQSDIGAYTMRGNFPVPQVKIQGSNLLLSHLMIGRRGFPRLSRGIFCTLMREAGATNADEVFDNILFFNRMNFLKLLAVLETHPGEMSLTLRRMARYQLEAMAYCMGKREL
jgi:hypothetical protein